MLYVCFIDEKLIIALFQKIKKPSWCVKDPAIKAAVDLAAIAPIGYAAHLVFKQARGKTIVLLGHIQNVFISSIFQVLI